jgi:nitrite reductase/ring-hydroxylating ferredoxin subunit
VTAWHDVADADTVVRGMLEAEAAGHAFLLLSVSGEIFAVDAVCPHHQAWLSMGHQDGDAIACPRHQGRFDIATGRQLGGPPCPPLPTYPVRVVAGRVLVGVA